MQLINHNRMNKMKVWPLLGICLFLVTTPLLSQITLTREDMPDVNDTIRLSRTFTTGGVDHTLTGEDYVWDFSSLTPVTQYVDTFVSVLSTPPIYQLVFLYPFVATIAQPVPDIDFIPGFEVTDGFIYYKETDVQFHQAGVAFKLSGLSVPLRFDEPDILYTFPMNYGNVDSCESSLELDLPDLIYLSMEAERKNTVDGWGTLVTPFGSYETLRLKSEVSQYDSIYIDSLNIGVGIPRNFIQYKWMANGMGVPLLQIDVEGLIVTVNYIDSVRIITALDEKVAQSGGLKIFPNPSSDWITVEWKDEQCNIAFLRILDGNGNEIHRKECYPVHSAYFREAFSLPDLNLTPGVYLVCVSTEKMFISAKLIVNR